MHWDVWPSGWLDAAADCTSALWCFLPLRQFAAPPYRGREFAAAGWRLSQDLEPAHDVAADHLTWEKHNGSSFAADRFRRVHEIVTHDLPACGQATVVLLILHVLFPKCQRSVKAQG